MMPYRIRGCAPTTRLDRDTSICDMCGEPATQIRDFSTQLPDYYGFCEEHTSVADAENREQV